MAMGTDRSYTAGKFAFELDGTRVGFLQSFDGGNMSAELATHKMGPSNYEKKNVTTIKWTPLKMRTGIGMSKGLYQWIQAAFDMGVMYKNGAITVADFNYKAQRRMDVENMLMTKVTMPTLSGDSKETGYFDIEVLPERCRWMKEGGQDVRGQIGAKQKGWHCANWRLEIGGLPTKRVAKIEGLAWECKTVMDSIGDARENTIHPVATTVTDFTIHVSMADLEAWQAKAKQWFVDGACLEGDEMTAAITLLGPNMSTEYGRIELLNVGLKEFNAHGKLEGQTENVARFQVKLYAEQIKFVLSEVDA
jgi:phage tail-like protein